MKRILSLVCLLSFISVNAEEKAAKTKNYTEDEVKKMVQEGVEKEIKKMQNVNLGELTKEVLDKEDKLKYEQERLKKREQQIDIAAKELEKKVKEFEAERVQFYGCIKKNEEEVKQRVGMLVEVISNMKPEKAAQVLSVQTPDVAVRILAQLDPKKTSKIFNFMDKEISARLQKDYLDMKR